MVQLAQRQAIRHDRLSSRMAIRQDVCCVQELGVIVQTADRAANAVGKYDPGAEPRLVDPLLHHARDVPTTREIMRASELRHRWLVRLDRERETAGIVADDVHGKDGGVPTWGDAGKVHQGRLTFERST